MTTMCSGLDMIKAYLALKVSQPYTHLLVSFICCISQAFSLYNKKQSRFST